MKCLSIKQPWSYLIVNGYKDVENRTWQTSFRGPFFIHADKSYDAAAFDWILEHFPELRGVIPACKHEYDKGGIIGRAILVNCVNHSDSPWFQGPWGFVLADAKPIEFIPMQGQLGFFEFDSSVLP